MEDTLNLKYRNLFAFTLAEVLITLAVIGIIAVIIILPLQAKVNEMSWAKAQDNFEAILTEATKQMNVAGILSGYSTNDAFVSAFQKYIKISKRCDSNSLSSCFVPNFYTASGENINTTDLKTGADFGKSDNTNSLVGAQLIDGINAIIAFDPNCNPPEWYSSGGGAYKNNDDSSSRNYAAGATTACLSMVYDVNGFKGPNTIGKDILTFNAVITNCDGKKIDGLCIGAADISYSGISEEPYTQAMFPNTWAGARKKCESLGMRLPHGSELEKMYQNRDTIGGFSGDWYWSGDEKDSYNVWVKDFDAGGPPGLYYNPKDYSAYFFKARCVK